VLIVSFWGGLCICFKQKKILTQNIFLFFFFSNVKMSKQPATFPPALREPPPPALDQFDLDEHFASKRIRLAQLTNKCTDNDLDYFVREAGETLGVTGQLPVAQLRQPQGAKLILYFIAEKIANFKKLNQEGRVTGQVVGVVQ
jgi:intraflagellar transport protein 52